MSAQEAGPCSSSVTHTTFLSSGFAPVKEPNAPLACDLVDRGPPQVRLLSLSTPEGVTVGVGHGGQIYSIRIPGIGLDLIPAQRPGSTFVDEVFQTVATNRAERRASPRGQAMAKGQRNHNDAGWHYHQAGAYSRGVLAGVPPVYSALLMERLRSDKGTLETLSLSVQAHPTQVAGDRFLVYMQLHYEGKGVFKLTQGWINNSRDDFGEPSTLDFFNLPWMVFSQRAVPYIGIQTAEGWQDISSEPWPPKPGSGVAKAQWLGAFAGPGADQPGMGVVLYSGGTDTLRYGGRPSVAVGENGAAGAVDERLFIASDLHSSDTLSPGEGLFATLYLVFGTRASVSTTAQGLVGDVSMRKLRIAPSTKPEDIRPLCSSSAGLQSCAPGQAPQVALSGALCTACLPVFELKNGEAITYSTEPYLGQLGANYLSDPAYKIDRIVGWLVPSDSPAPTGFRKVALGKEGPLSIKYAKTDIGRFSYFARQDTTSGAKQEGQ